VARLTGTPPRLRTLRGWAVPLLLGLVGVNAAA